MPEEKAEDSSVVVIRANPARKVFRPNSKALNKVPNEILEDPLLNAAIAQLPSNYNLEIHKTIWRIKSTEAKRVALQMPEGLLMFATRICDIIHNFTEADTVIMGDVTYGACCIDDYTARALGVDLLVHYGHSCLIPVDRMPDLKVLYIFVDIKIDAVHFVETVKANFQITTRLCFVSTIQFVTTLHAVGISLRKEGYDITIPQCKPLSPGEVLGCTAPTLPENSVDAIIYLGDGRFHLEAAMLANPKLKAYRYDPYDRKFTEEIYEHEIVLDKRRSSILKASQAGKFGLILGTLGRQGNPNVLNNIKCQLGKKGKSFVTLLLSEIYPSKLNVFGDGIEAWIQVACPRLSIDWGSQFEKPLLSPWEAAVALGQTDSIEKPLKNGIPMEFYSAESSGPWAPNFKKECCGKGCKK